MANPGHPGVVPILLALTKNLYAKLLDSEDDAQEE